MKRYPLIVACAALLVTLSACGSPAVEPDSAPSAGPAPSEEPTPAPPTPTPSPTPTGVDRTYEARTAGGGIVSKAIEEPVGTITIFTDVASPYSAAQETARYEAIVACEAVRASMGATTVLVLDAGDDPFIIFNGSNFAECAVK